MSCAGIDLGNRNCVIALARRGGIDVVANEVSNRATPCMVGFQGEERHIGEAAATFAMQNFKNTCTDLRCLLSVKAQTTEAELQKKRVKFNLVDDENGFLAAECTYGRDGAKTIFSFEALTGAILSKLLQTASNENNAVVTECVVSVPGYYSDRQRRALLDAGSIGNIKILRLLNEHASIALTYGIFRTADLPDKDPLKIVFVDVGEHKTTVCVAEFLKSGVKILSTAHDDQLGGRDWDELLVNHFAAEFKEKYKIDVLSAARPTLRLRAACEKLKKVLSSIGSSQLNVECLMDDIDVSGEMKREDYESMTMPLLERLSALCKKAMEDAGIKDVSTLHGVEIIGGGCRVPSVKAAIESSFGKPVSTTLNADEAVARGCALMSAMLSPTFKVKDYAVTDTTGSSLSVTRTSDSDMVEGDAIPLVAKHDAFPCSKAVSFKNAGPCKLVLKQDKTIPIADYAIEAPAPSAEEPAKIRVKIKVDQNGVSEVVDAALQTEFEVEVPVEEKKPAPEPKPDAEKAPEAKMETVESAKDGKPAEETAEPAAPATAEPVPAPAPKMKKVKKVKSTPLVFKRGTVCIGLSGDQLQRAIEFEGEMKASDLYIRERNEALNALESFVYEARSKLSGGELEPFAPAAIRDTILQDLSVAEDWIYSEDGGDIAAKSAFQEKRAGLMAQIAPIKARKIEAEERPVLVEHIKELILKLKEVAVPNNEKYEHLTDEEKSTVVKTCEDAMLWLTKVVNEQNALPKDVDPTLTRQVLTAKKDEIVATCKPIVEKPKPKVESPKPAENADATANPAAAPAADSGNPPADAPPGTADGETAKDTEMAAEDTSLKDEEMSKENGEAATPTQQ